MPENFVVEPLVDALDLLHETIPLVNALEYLEDDDANLFTQHIEAPPKFAPLRNPWSSREDELLKRAVQRVQNDVAADNANGKMTRFNWSSVATYMEPVGRTSKQCYNRFHEHIGPTINRMPFTRAESQLVLEEYLQHGRKWASICKKLENRTASQVKNFVLSQHARDDPKVPDKRVRDYKKENERKRQLAQMEYKSAIQPAKRDPGLRFTTGIEPGRVTKRYNAMNAKLIHDNDKLVEVTDVMAVASGGALRQKKLKFINKILNPNPSSSLTPPPTTLRWRA